MVKGPTFEVFTLFPELIQGVLSHGLLGKALKQEYLKVFLTNYRQFADNPRGTVDDTPYGGGPGMVMRCEPVVAALEHVIAERGPMHRILLTPSAPRFNQQIAERLAILPRIGLICGRYEGIDDRVREAFVDECISIGDFILNGGEVAALAMMEAVARLCEGVLGNPQSMTKESFVQTSDSGAWLEAPQYTRPEQFRGHTVPSVLRSGDHQAIAKWRATQSWLRTWQIRPDLRFQVKSLPVPPIYLLPLLGDQQPAEYVERDLQELVNYFPQVTVLPASNFEPQQLLRKLHKIHHRPIQPILVRLWANLDESLDFSVNIPFIRNSKQLLDFLAINGENKINGPLLLLVSYNTEKSISDSWISLIPLDWQKFIQAIFVPNRISKRDLQLELAKQSPISESSQSQALAKPILELVASALIQLQSY